MRKALDPGRLKDVYDRAAGRYDLQHALLTARSDERGRRLLVRHAVRRDDRVLDCGAGTGTTGLMALREVGPRGKVVLLDASEGMLEVAKRKAARLEALKQVEFRVGDLLNLPFEDGAFDVVLSTYSLCPVFDPARGAREIYRVTRPGGRIGVAHSTDPRGALTKWLADGVESVAWRIPALSLGCRSVSVLPVLRELGCKVLFERRVGVPLWPFFVFVVEKPVA